MSKFFFSLILCLVSFVSLAAEPDSSVVFKASFLKNELQAYEISRASYTLTNGDTTSLERIRLNADVYVKDSTQEYYLMAWRFSGFSIGTDNQQLVKLMALAKPVEISYRVSRPGVFMEFLNGDNVSNCLKDALPQMLGTFAGKKDSLSKVQVTQIYDMRETLETLMLRSIAQFHQAYGLGYKLDEVVDVPTEVESRFSATPIKGVIRKKLTKIDWDNHLAVLSTATFLDNKEFQKAFRTYLKMDSMPESALGQDNLGAIVLDLNTGWVLWTIDQRETKVGRDRYGEQVEIQHK